jgi:hypothetical protein
MNRFVNLSEPDRASKQRSVHHLVRWLNMICATGVLLASATGAVAVLSGSNFPPGGKGEPHSQQAGPRKITEPKTAATAKEAPIIEAKTTRANPRPFVMPSLSTVTPVSIIEAAEMVDKAEAGAKTPQGLSKTSDATPTLAIDQVITGWPRQPTLFPLLVNADGVVPDNSLIAIHGLPKGTVLSAGRSDGAGGWLLAPDDLGGGLSITPGDDADGSSDLVVQLLTPEGRVASELHTRLIVSGGVKAGESHELALKATPQQIQVLLSHGRELQRVGYLAGARLFFQRAADAGSAEGARALGETYDPVEFQKLGVRGMAPDPALAQEWYDRARTLEGKTLKQTGTAE